LGATVVAPLTSDRASVRQALASLQAGDRQADLERALELARALAPEGEIHLFTDSPPPAGDFSYHGLAGDARNYGITTFDTGIGQAYLAVSSNDRRPQELTLELFRDDQVIARTTLVVPASGQANVTFPVEPASGFIAARLQVPAEDGLSLDDVAFAGQRQLQVVVEEPSGPVLKALAALAGVEARVVRQAERAAGDARVLFGDDPAELPDGDVLLFAAPAEEPVYRSIRDWAQGDELLRFVDLRDVVVGLSPDLDQEEQADWETLARASDLTPVLSRKTEDGRTIVRAAFHPSQTDLVLRPAFPALIANVMSSFRGAETVPLGSPLPAGATFGRREVTRALEPGIYDTPGGPVAASLLSVEETVLPGRPAASPVQPRATSAGRDGNRRLGLALWLIAAAVAILLIEWLAWARGSSGWLRGG
jgi:hypothetical protein